MPLYFFDVHDGGVTQDEIGTECATQSDALKAARSLLPDIARDDMPRDGDRRVFTIVLRDDTRRPIYTATLSYCGLKLIE